MIQKLPPSLRKDPMKSLKTQLRKKGLEMVPGPVLDPEFGRIYTFQPVKPGSLSNSDVAGRLYYEGEVAKWSVSRRKAVSKAAVNGKGKAKVEAKRTVEECSGGREKENSSSSSPSSPSSTSTSGESGAD